MTEEGELKKEIKEKLTEAGAYWVLVQEGAHAKVGDPDIVACYLGQFIGIEAKTYEGVQSNWQKTRETQIKFAGGEYVLARSWEDVAKVLENIRNPEDPWKDEL